MRFLLPLLLAACLPENTNGIAAGGGLNGDGGAANPPQDCADMADALATAEMQQCGQDYKSTYDGFVGAAANGDCRNIVKVRDEGALRNTCLPSFAKTSCSDLEAGILDPSCTKQLLLE